MAWTTYTWGSTALLVAKDSYTPPAAENGITEIQLLPDLAVSTPATVLQQAGRGRKRVSFDGYATETDYYAFLADYYAVTTRTFTDSDGNTLSSIIESISAARENGPYPYRYSITLVEA